MQSCDKYWSTAKNDPNVKKACAVLFDENCCKASSKMKTRTSRAMGALRLMKTCCTFFVLSRELLSVALIILLQ